MLPHRGDTVAMWTMRRQSCVCCSCGNNTFNTKCNQWNIYLTSWLYIYIPFLWLQNKNPTYFDLIHMLDWKRSQKLIRHITIKPFINACAYDNNQKQIMWWISLLICVLVFWNLCKNCVYLMTWKMIAVDFAYKLCECSGPGLWLLVK